jgi:hypothetical protein
MANFGDWFTRFQFFLLGLGTLSARLGYVMVVAPVKLARTWELDLPVRIGNFHFHQITGRFCVSARRSNQRRLIIGGFGGDITRAICLGIDQAASKSSRFSELAESPLSE